MHTQSNHIETQPRLKAQNDHAKPLKSFSQLESEYVARTQNRIIHYLEHIAKQSIHKSKYPILKLLTVVNKIFLFNEVQIIYFDIFLKKTHQEIHDQAIKNYQKCVILDFSYDFTDQKQLNQLLLYYILVGFYVKFILNQEKEIFKKEISRYCSNFGHIFKRWQAQPQIKSITRISLKQVNQTFKKLVIDTDQPDISIEVDSIVALTPGYDKSKKSKQQHSLCIPLSNSKQNQRPIESISIEEMIDWDGQANQTKEKKQTN